MEFFLASSVAFVADGFITPSKETSLPSIEALSSKFFVAPIKETAVAQIHVLCQKGETTNPVPTFQSSA